MHRDFLVEGSALCDLRLREMRVSMRHVQLAQGLPDRLLAQPGPGGALVLIGVRAISDVLGKLFGVDLADFPALARLWMQALRPAFERRNADTEPL